MSKSQSSSLFSSSSKTKKQTPDDLAETDEDDDETESAGTDSFGNRGLYKTGIADEVECDQFGNPLNDVREISKELNRNFSDAALGARKVMAATYQSCQSLLMTMPPRESRNIYNVLGADDRPQCVEPSGTPGYGWGKKMSFLNGIIDLFKSGKPQIDCSGFVTASYAASGLRIYEDRDNPDSYGCNTIEMLQIMDRPGSCLRSVNMIGEDSLQSGDVIIQQNGLNNNRRHMVMVETVGKDPFALGEITSRDQCRYQNLDTRKFDFTLIQSTSGGGKKLGVSRWKAKDYLPRSGSSFRGAVIELAMHACLAKFSGDTPVKAADTKSSTPRYGLVRHRSGDPICRNPNPPKIQGQECIDECPQLRRGDPGMI